MSSIRLKTVLLVCAAMIASVVAGFPQPAPVSADDGDELIAIDDVAFTDSGTAVTIDVTDNDSDDSDDDDAVLTVSGATNGTFTVVFEDDEPSVRFEPDPGFDGIATFDYEICVEGSCASASVQVYVGLSGCTIVGTDGADTLVGTDDDDVICALDGADVVDAGGGDDVVFGGRGKDTLNGGPGADTLHGNRGDDTINGGDGPDRLHGGKGSDLVAGNRGQDFLAGGKGADVLSGGKGRDTLMGKAGDDTLSGGNGDDELRGWRGEDILNGGDGDDKLYGGRNADVLNGGPGDDLLKGKKGSDSLNGDAGNDDLRGDKGDDTLVGGEDIDVLDGGNGTDTCDGETITNCEDGPVDPEPGLVFCNDLVADIVGTEGDDVLFGTPGADVIAGLGGDDQIDGLSGDDVICGGDGIDTISGGDGDDLLSGDSGPDVINGGHGRDLVVGGDGDDNLVGGTEDDTLLGDDGNDDLAGGGGNDDLDGNAGDDTLSGDSGDDVIDGGEGTDSADGGEGTDVCLDAEAISECESESDPTDPLIALKALDPSPLTVDVPAGLVTAQSLGSEDPAVVIVDSPGGVRSTDIVVSRDFSGLARTISDLQVGPVFSINVAEGTPGFTGASVTLPYSEDTLGGFPEADLAVAKYSPADGRWVVLDTSVAADSNTATAELILTAGNFQIAAGLDGLAAEPPDGNLTGSYVVIKVEDSFGLDKYRQQLERVADAQAGIGCSVIDDGGPVSFFLNAPTSETASYDNIWTAVQTDSTTVWYVEGSAPDFDGAPGSAVGSLRRVDVTTGQVTIIQSGIYASSGVVTRRSHRLAELHATSDGGVILVEQLYSPISIRLSKFDAGGALEYSATDSDGVHLWGSVYDEALNLVYVLRSEDNAIPLSNRPGTMEILSYDAGNGFAVSWTNNPPAAGFNYGNVALEMSVDGPAAVYDLDASTYYARFSHDGAHLSTSTTEPALLPLGEYVEIESGPYPTISYHQQDGTLITSVGLDANILWSRFVQVSDIVDGYFLLYGTIANGLPRADGTETSPGSFIARVDPAQFGDFFEAPTAIADNDGDGLPDCEEEVGLPSMSWISKTGGAAEQEPFIVQLSTSTLDLDGPDLDGPLEGWDTDEDGLGDGEEIEAFPVSSAPFLSPDERTILLDIGVTKIYKASTLPYEQDSDFDGNTDAEEIEDGTDPMFPNYDFLGNAIYPTNTILQPAAFGTTPFLSVFAQVTKESNVQDGSVDITLATKEVREVVTYDGKYDCIETCGPWFEQFVGFDPLDPDHVAAAREAMKRAIVAQDVFHLDVNPDDIFVSSSVMQGYLWKNCILLGTPSEDCGGGQIVANGAGPLPLDITYLTSVPAPVRELRIQSDIATKTRPILEGDRPPGEQGSRWKIGTGTALTAAAVVFAKLLHSDEALSDTEKRLEECERAVSTGGNSVALLAIGNPLSYEGLNAPHCSGLPIYFPGEDLRIATALRVDAIFNKLQPAILSHRTRVFTEDKFTSEWYRRLPWDCKTALKACDEYPNAASGEAGPKSGITAFDWDNLGPSDPDTNHRTASLCLTADQDANTTEGTRFRSFKIESAVNTRAGNYFIVVPMPNLPTNWGGKSRDSFPFRDDSGSYPDPGNFEPAPDAPRAAWQSSAVWAGNTCG